MEEDSISSSSCLQVKDLAQDTNQDEIDTLFWAFGELVHCQLAKGIATIEYVEQASADLAMNTLNGRTFRGAVLNIESGTESKKKRKPLVEKKRIVVPRGKSPLNLYVNHLPKEYNEDQLKELFGQYGQVESVRIFKHKPEAKDSTACIRYAKKRGAAEAIDALHNTTLEEHTISVEYAVDKKRDALDPYVPQEENEQNNIFIKGLAPETKEDELKELFGQFGTVDSIKVFTGKFTKEPLGTACVRMRNHKEAASAINALNETMLGENEITVEWAKNKAKRNLNLGGYNQNPAFAYTSYTPGAPRYGGNRYNPYGGRGGFSTTNTYRHAAMVQRGW